MGNNEKRTLEEVLNSLDEKQRQTTQSLQNLIKSIIPEATEIIRHGSITYVLDGKILLVKLKQNGHVDVNSLTVSHWLPCFENHGIKEKNNKSVRHVEVHNFEKYSDEVARLLKADKQIWLEQYPKTPA
jgi:hypothetical protein